MDPESEVFNPTPDVVSRVLLLIETGRPARGHITRAIYLSDGRFVKTGCSGQRLKTEARAMLFVRKVRPPGLIIIKSNSVFLAHQYSCPKGPYGV